MKRTSFASSLLTLFLLTGCSDGAPDAAPLTIVPTAAPEGAPGEMRPLTLRVTLTEPLSDEVSIRYATTDGTATPGEDYVSSSGEAIIEAGQIETFITLEMLGDALLEPSETIGLDIEIDGPASLTNESVVATIADDDNACDTPYSSNPNPWLVGDGDPLNFAHRGGVTDFPENTLYAYAEAARAGVDVLEMDVYQTADNELVILHDLTVDRTTNGTGRVVDLTLAELRELDAGYWFVQDEGTPRDLPDEAYEFRGIATGDKTPPPGYSAEDFRIPTLEEALARFPHDLINVELKPDLDETGNYEQQIANLLQQYGRSTDVIAASFVDEAANNFKAAAPCVYTSIPLEQGTGLVLLFLADGGTEFPEVPEHVTWQVPPDTSQIGQLDLDLVIVTQDFVDASHAANLAVQTWTINTCEEMLRMMELGVDGIMTDEPILLEELLATPPDERSCD
ncbi:MAG: glycerophosphodiester phosphodiesterase family protein [Myxococcota bacterium]